MASFPRSLLCGIIPRTVRQKIFPGARKWKGPRRGFTLHLRRKNFKYFSLLRQKLPLMLIPSHLTTITLLPLRMNLATVEASRPNKWPRPSITTGQKKNQMVDNQLMDVKANYFQKNCCNFARLSEITLVFSIRVNKVEMSYKLSCFLDLLSISLQQNYEKFKKLPQG